MTRIGYARVSTRDQHIGAQVERLMANGCGRVFTDEGVSGKLASRPEWDACLASLGANDVLVCTKLDRVGRSVANLLQLAADLKEREIGLVCLDQNIDTTSAMGMMFYTILGAFAEFERNLISERTKDGLAATEGRGRNGGRHPKMSPLQLVEAQQSIDAGTPVATVAGTYGVSRGTLYRSLARASLWLATGPAGRTSARGVAMARTMMTWPRVCAVSALSVVRTRASRRCRTRSSSAPVRRARRKATAPGGCACAVAVTPRAGWSPGPWTGSPSTPTDLALLPLVAVGLLSAPS
jgi:DNA invertase Pin-like site-specific DNA recombinase